MPGEEGSPFLTSTTFSTTTRYQNGLILFLILLRSLDGSLPNLCKRHKLKPKREGREGGMMLGRLCEAEGEGRRGFGWVRGGRPRR